MTRTAIMETIGWLTDRAARAWPLVQANVVQASAVGIALFAVIYTLERLHGAPTGQYRSRGVLHDLAYWFYYRSGLHSFVFLTLLFGVFAGALAPLRGKLLEGIPFVLQVPIYLVVVDFCVYWIHRAQHRFAFLWVFHATHHSQRDLNFLTSQRVHPIDHFVQDVCMFVPLWLLGFGESAWLPLYLLGEFTLAAQHSRIPWRYGPLYRVIVSPVFHSYHHSVDPAHHDRNFAGLFSFWDYLFGTAARDEGRAPEQFGLTDEPGNSLVGTLTAPLRLLRGDSVRS